MVLEASLKENLVERLVQRGANENDVESALEMLSTIWMLSDF